MLQDILLTLLQGNSLTETISASLNSGSSLSVSLRIFQVINTAYESPGNVTRGRSVSVISRCEPGDSIVRG